MNQSTDPCSIRACPRPAVEMVSLDVEGYPSPLLVCQRHAEWLRSYAEEDAYVRSVDPAESA